MLNKIEDCLPEIDAANVWAKGCHQCAYGLIDPPPVTDVSVALYIARAFQWQFGVLLTCDCRAGQLYAKYMRKVWEDIIGKDEHTPATWSTAMHEQINARAGHAPTPVTQHANQKAKGV